MRWSRDAARGGEQGLTASSLARVTSFEILSEKPIFDGQSFGKVGAYVWPECDKGESLSFRLENIREVKQAISKPEFAQFLATGAGGQLPTFVGPDAFAKELASEWEMTNTLLRKLGVTPQ